MQEEEKQQKGIQACDFERINEKTIKKSAKYMSFVV